ncbi:cytochrome P450 [Mycena rebaudengoi]|nr:cytochrome P450 [Mycena rebaudengoi]
MPSHLDFFLVICALGFLLTRRLGHRERGLPPGPPTLPFIGNLHQLRKAGSKEMHLKLAEWSRQYGDIVSIKIGSSTMVVLSSATAIKEVVDKQGWAGSSRPPNYLAGRAAGGYHILFAPSDPRLHSLKNVLSRFFAPHNYLKHLPIQTAESVQLLHDLMNHPTEFVDSILRYTNSIAMITVYGQRVPSFSSLRMQRFYKALRQFLNISVQGNYPPIDALPFLKYLPEHWAPWLAACRRSKSDMAALHAEFSRAAEKCFVSADQEDNHCFMNHILQMGLAQKEYDTFSYAGFTLVEAGSHPSAAFVLSLVFVLASYPEYQERAREEIYSVVGTGRLPELDDFKKMPFVDALIKEIIRMRPEFPMGTPHFTTQDLHYKDYTLKKNTTLILNIYALYHDPNVFENPEEFNPDRFMVSEYGTRPGMDTDFRDNFLFGGGRRICPGQVVAQVLMQLTAMRLIWAFQFGSPIDAETGVAIPRGLDFYGHEFVVMPRPFKCAIQQRSGEHRDVIFQAFEDAKSVLGRYEDKL